MPLETTAAPESGTAPRRRPRLGLHVVTWLALLVTAMVLFFLNVPGQVEVEPYRTAADGSIQEDYWAFGLIEIGRHDLIVHGWPTKYLMRLKWNSSPAFSEYSAWSLWRLDEAVLRFSAQALLIDIPIAVGILVLVGWRTQRRARKRRILRISLNDLLLGVLFASVALFWWRTIQVERARVQRLEDRFDVVFIHNPGGPNWLREWLGGSSWSESWGKPHWLQWFDRAVFANCVESAAIEELTQLHRLESLCISPYDDGKLPRPEHFGHLEKLTRLRALELSGSRITDECLANLGVPPRLEVLVLRGTAITDEGVSYLAKMTQLRALDLGNTQITNSAMQSVAGMSELRWLNISTTLIDDAGIESLAALPKLRTLHADYTQIEGPGLAGLRQLEALSLATPVADDETLRFVSMLPKLRRLILNDVNISAKGLRYLASLPRLERLALSSNSVDDEGILELSPLITLSELILGNTQVSAPGAERLKALLPGLAVEWWPPLAELPPHSAGEEAP